MPIELPDLDDKTHAELVDEAIAAIPGIYPAWTDHNPSDPGIVLVELLAWLTEMLIYRTGRTSEQSVRTFLRLLDGRATPVEEQRPLDEAIAATMRALRERYRAVTPEDYEQLALQRLADRGRARVRCLPERDLTSGENTEAAPGSVSLVVMSEGGLSKDIIPELRLFFRDRRLVGTRLHVVEPTRVAITVKATLRLRDDAIASIVRAHARQHLAAYLDAWAGGPRGHGWPFGRDVHVAEVYAVLDRVSGVESVHGVVLEALDRQVMVGAELVAVRIEPHELPLVQAGDIQLTLEERRRGTWTTIP